MWNYVLRLSPEGNFQKVSGYPRVPTIKYLFEFEMEDACSALKYESSKRSSASLHITEPSESKSDPNCRTSKSFQVSSNRNLQKFSQSWKCQSWSNSSILKWFHQSPCHLFPSEEKWIFLWCCQQLWKYSNLQNNCKSDNQTNFLG